MITISQTALFIINTVRMFRLELGLSQRDISKALNSNAISNLLGDIESGKRTNQYSDDQLNVIAILFTNVARNSSSHLKNKEFSIYDFYPSKPLADAQIVKLVSTIVPNLSPTGMINALIEEGKFFSEAVTIRQLTDFCNKLASKAWKTSDFTAQIEYAVNKGKLKRIDLPNGGVKYQKS